MFVKDVYAISPQLTFNLAFENGEIVEINADRYLAQEPNYLEFIPSGQLRRMGKAVRMGIGAGLPLIQRHSKLDGIIIGSANGGLEDCIKFLNQIVDYEEGVLTPTNFVQSTPNAMAGQLAILSDNSGYNSTHTNGSLAFENALIDAQLQLQQGTNTTAFLVGSVEEISEYNYNIDVHAGRYKGIATNNTSLLNSTTDGTICGEGATTFIISNDANNALAEIIAINQITYPTAKELQELIQSLLQENGLNTAAIDTLVLGNNGDGRLDHWYNETVSPLFTVAQTLHYKQFVGDYRTVSAFGLYFTVQHMLGLLTSNTKERPKFALIYNHFDGIRHGFILVKNSAKI